jgi:hypothetical protein
MFTPENLLGKWEDGFLLIQRIQLTGAEFDRLTKL